MDKFPDRIFKDEGASSLEIRTGMFSKSVTLWTPLQSSSGFSLFFFCLTSLLILAISVVPDEDLWCRNVEKFRRCVRVQSYVREYMQFAAIVQELCESRGGRPGLSVLTSLLVSVDVKIYCTVLRHWSQLVPNMSTDI